MSILEKVSATIRGVIYKDEINRQKQLQARLEEEREAFSLVEWDNIPDPPKVYLATPHYQSIPFVKLKSPVFANQNKPLLDFDVGVGAGFEARQILEENYQHFISKNTNNWGPSSSMSVDFDKLTSATQMLAEGVLEGDVQKVRQALDQNADPYMTVATLHPNVHSKNPIYVQMPLGVAAIMLGQAKSKESGDDSIMHSYNEVARQLLVTKDGKPRIEVGNSNKNDGGSAIAYYAKGMKWTGEYAGQESNEIRNIEIPLSLRSQIVNVASETLVDGKVLKTTDGYVHGEKLPDSIMRANFYNVDIEELSLNNAIASFRERKLSNRQSGFEEDAIRDRTYNP